MNDWLACNQMLGAVYRVAFGVAEFSNGMQAKQVRFPVGITPSAAIVTRTPGMLIQPPPKNSVHQIQYQEHRHNHDQMKR